MSQIEILPVRCLKDNYAYLLHADGRTALFDAPEAAPILAELAARGWSLDLIALTHHHPDHIQAVSDLVAMTGARIMGNALDAARLPALDIALQPGETTDICDEPALVIDVSGHTIGHIAFYLPESDMAFTADSLMALGCGRGWALIGCGAVVLILRAGSMTCGWRLPVYKARPPR